jgi:hypothetical protein
MAHPGKVAICLGSDGSQMEGNDSEAARLAVAQGLNVKVAFTLSHSHQFSVSSAESFYLCSV